MSAYLSRKFLLTIAPFVIGTAAFWTHRMDGGTWVALVTLLLGVYSGANVADKKLNGAQ